MRVKIWSMLTKIKKWLNINYQKHDYGWWLVAGSTFSTLDEHERKPFLWLIEVEKDINIFPSIEFNIKLSSRDKGRHVNDPDYRFILLFVVIHTTIKFVGIVRKNNENTPVQPLLEDKVDMDGISG